MAKKIIFTKSREIKPQSPLLALVKTFEQTNTDYEIITTDFSYRLSPEMQLMDLNPTKYTTIFDHLTHHVNVRPLPFEDRDVYSLLKVEEPKEFFIKLIGNQWFSNQNRNKIVKYDQGRRQIDGISYQDFGLDINYQWNGGQPIVITEHKEQGYKTYEMFDEESGKLVLSFSDRDGQMYSDIRYGQDQQTQVQGIKGLVELFFQVYPDYLNQDIYFVDDLELFDYFQNIDLRPNSLTLFLNEPLQPLDQTVIDFINKNAQRVFVPNPVAYQKLSARLENGKLKLLPFATTYESTKVYYRAPGVRKITVFSDFNREGLETFISPLAEIESVDEVLVVGVGPFQSDVRSKIQNSKINFIGAPNLNSMNRYFENVIGFVDLEEITASQYMKFEAISRLLPVFAANFAGDADYASELFDNLEKLASMAQELSDNITFESVVRNSTYKNALRFKLENFEREVM
ncbi:MAG: hypothetical protein LBM27_01990 [Lactobacillaceae bacterium]|jgi:hypothetical protein|nr:hypothetical protein [Lactobacillaceae bacterium]